MAHGPWPILSRLTRPVCGRSGRVRAPRLPRQRAMWALVLPTLRNARTLPGVDSTLTAAAIGVGSTAIVGVAGFWASVRNTNKTTALTLRALELTEQGQVTDRYTKAVGQLGDESSPVRVGGIYALERIGHDSPKDRTTIIYVLGAFIRERSRVPERDEQPPEDVMAGIRVVGRLLPLSEVKLNLRGADLRNTDMSDLPRISGAT